MDVITSFLSYDTKTDIIQRVSPVGQGLPLRISWVRIPAPASDKIIRGITHEKQSRYRRPN